MPEALKKRYCHPVLEVFEKPSSKSPPVLEEGLGGSNTEVFQRALLKFFGAGSHPMLS
jgi:hypothetical protein